MLSESSVTHCDITQFERLVYTVAAETKRTIILLN